MPEITRTFQSPYRFVRIRPVRALTLSIIGHIVLLALLFTRPFEARQDDETELIIAVNHTSQPRQLSRLEPVVVEMEVQQETAEVVEPHLNLEVQMDRLGGAAGSYVSADAMLVSELSKLRGLSITGAGAGSGNAERGSGAGAGGTGKYVAPFEHLVEELKLGLDLVIVFDSTSSMGPEIQALKMHVVQLGKAMLLVLPETRIAFVTYKDYGDAPVVAFSDLTSDLDSLVRFLARVQPSGGGNNIEEAVGLGIAQAVDGYAFRDEAHHVIIVLGDAPPHSKEMPAILKLASRFAASGNCRLSTVSIRANFPLPRFNSIAHYGGGESIVLGRHAGILQELLLLVFGQANRHDAMRLLGF